MKERPIIMNSESVRAILEGRKTQTRRVIKPQPRLEDEWNEVTGAAWSVWWKNWEESFENVYEELPSFCPYGKVGDRLYVKETWVSLLHTSPMTGEPLEPQNGDRLITHATYRETNGKKIWRYDGEVIAYKATSTVTFCDGDGFSGDLANKEEMPRWRSPMFMPKRFSRIMLEITDIRVEQVQDISEQDAVAEGLEAWSDSVGSSRESGQSFSVTAAEQYKDLWDSLNTKRGHSWDSNPWVWVLEFKVVENG